MKMIKTKAILVLLACYSLASCDTMYVFEVDNLSKEEKRIEVIGNPLYSVRLSEPRAQGGWWYVKSIAVDKLDNGLPKFSFVLGPYQEATLELGFGIRPMTRQVIIDRTDTVFVRHSKGRVKKKLFPLIGGDYTLTIKN